MKQLSQDGAVFDIGLPYTLSEYATLQNRKYMLQMAVAVPGPAPQRGVLGGVIKRTRAFGTEFMVECSSQDDWEFFWSEVCQSEQALANDTGMLTLSLGFYGYRPE